ncbi:osm1 [Symbiodinium natans]|uniref:Osm1 protein n=1 Tax=Symbiodinium natans TaxID=878477 RepID=A0A812N9S1_9DINO|nr:osm1 [Symbiodinium natans]
MINSQLGTPHVGNPHIFLNLTARCKHLWHYGWGARSAGSARRLHVYPPAVQIVKTAASKESASQHHVTRHAGQSTSAQVIEGFLVATCLLICCDAMRFAHSGLESLDAVGGWEGIPGGRCHHSQQFASFLTIDTVHPRPRRSSDFVSFFREEDLAPPGGLPPPNGWGEGNDSPCTTCACSDQHGEGAEEEVKAEEELPKMVFPNVPHHSFFPHRRGYKLSQFKVFALFIAGLGCGYAAASSLTRKEEPMELGRNEEVAGARTAAA